MIMENETYFIVRTKTNYGIELSFEEYTELLKVGSHNPNKKMSLNTHPRPNIKSLEDIIEITQITKAVIFKKDENVL